MAVALSSFVDALVTLAPLDLAEPWDNVGLLLPGREGLEIARALLTIDLTDAVLDEVRELDVDVVVSYHPILFDGKKRLRREIASERVALRAIERGIAVYSPHTALDASTQGLNDWLVDAVGPGRTRPLLQNVARPEAGQGRVRELESPTSLSTIVTLCRAHLGLPALRVAASERHARGEPIATVAVAAGAGGPLLAKATGADLFITGEMRHHDVLAAVEAGTSVILAEHTGSERGFLPILAGRLRSALARAVEVHVSGRDRDPVESTTD